MAEMTEVKERPLLFSAPMVRANRAEMKTQTRRTSGLNEINSGPDSLSLQKIEDGFATFRHSEGHFKIVRCPYGKPGDRLWVKETHWIVERKGRGVGVPYLIYGDEWNGSEPNEKTPLRPWLGAFSRFGQRPSIHMPRWASRDLLEITAIRAERVQEISGEDAIAEGVSATEFWNPKEVDENPKPTHEWAEPFWDDFYFWSHYPQRVYRKLWESINGPESWQANPWVWVVEYRRLEVPHV